MPVKSKAQAAFLGINHPDILRRWQKEAHRRIKDLPYHVKAKKTRKAIRQAM